ncbi:hypothetical protein [Streptomyces sp. NPDC088725]|uniref:hypothetical protein n=1 Tax=Streptomyces sp. NPDC088725 TaxID=3365873 RepID=UPI0037F804A2
MKWAQAFSRAMEELAAIRGQLGEAASGATALRGELGQTGQKVLDSVQSGTLVLREENRELRARQDKALGELAEARSEIRAVRLELARSAAAAAAVAESASGAGEAAASGPPEHSGAVVVAAPRGRGATVPAGDDRSEERYVYQDGAGPARGNGRENESHVPGTDRDGDASDWAALKKAAEDSCSGTPAVSRAIPAQRGPASEARQPRGERSEEQDADPRVAHGALLLTAAGVSSAELVCHRDTWEFLAGLAARQPHFRTPPAVEDADRGRVRAALSGRSFIALLIALWDTRRQSAPFEADWALATTAYRRIADELRAVTPGASRDTVRIALDDGIQQDAPAAA